MTFISFVHHVHPKINIINPSWIACLFVNSTKHHESEFTPAGSIIKLIQYPGRNNSDPSQHAFFRHLYMIVNYFTAKSTRIGIPYKNLEDTRIRPWMVFLQKPLVFMVEMETFASMENALIPFRNNMKKKKLFGLWVS